jgi:hypothetical protein
MVLPRTTVAGCYDHNVTTLLQRGQGKAWRECFWTVRPKQVLLATGAIEQGMIFRNNDRPGIMLAGAVRHYVNLYALMPGRKVIVATTNDTAYQAVLDLQRHQVQVLAVVDCREGVDPALGSGWGSLVRSCCVAPGSPIRAEIAPFRRLRSSGWTARNWAGGPATCWRSRVAGLLGSTFTHTRVAGSGSMSQARPSCPIHSPLLSLGMPPPTSPSLVPPTARSASSSALPRLAPLPGRSVSGSA